MMNDEAEINKLPDAILTKIISFLDIKSAIRTSILSKKWMPLWTFLEDFDFDFDEYQRETDSLQSVYSWPHRQVALRSYLRFVNGVLSNRNHITKIGKFRLAFNNVYVNPIFIQNCVDYAISHNVEELDLGAYFRPKSFHFPTSFFESRSLCKLRLKYYFSKSLIIPKLFSLPSLRILYLEGFEFKDEDDFGFSKEPFSCFPKLQELTLDCCMVDGLTISAPELLVLELQFRGYQTPQYSNDCRILKVATPKLESFKFEGQVCLFCRMEDLPCLDMVYVDFYQILDSSVTEKMQISILKLLEQLKNAKSVALSFKSIEILSIDRDVLQQYPSPFVNLKHLKFVSKPREKLSSLLLSDNVMAYLTAASSFGDSIIVEIF